MGLVAHHTFLRGRAGAISAFPVFLASAYLGFVIGYHLVGWLTVDEPLARFVGGLIAAIPFGALGLYLLRAIGKESDLQEQFYALAIALTVIGCGIYLYVAGGWPSIPSEIMPRT
ncbi:MAG TPA: hypothetical protein VLF67_04420 [Candidatus Saccharimonas sp.]|nr:hypothetical protein [Candidatus Saccharimonas sp.]